MNKIFNKKIVCLLLIAVSFVLVFFNTALSPLYDPSYITHDASVFYVIGRGMKEGLMPYRDLFDHKGIYIYFLYYMAALIGENASIGLYIVFSILVSIFSIFVYMIVSMVQHKPLSNIFTSILIAIFSISLYYSHGALLCEYLALVTITISIYLVMKDIYAGLKLKPIYMLFHGILCAINIFNKANYSLYFVAVAAFVLVNIFAKKKGIGLLIQNATYGVIGLVIGFLPGILYCVVKGIVSDMLFATFTFNFSYVDDLNVDLPKEINTKWEAFIHCIKNYASTYLIIFASIFTLFYKKIRTKDKVYNDIIIFYMFALIALSISVFMALSAYSHYLTLIIPFMIPVILALFNNILSIFFDNKKVFFKVISIFIMAASLCITAYVIGGNELKVNFDTTAMQHKRIKKEISKYVKLNKNTNMLCFGLGSSFYNYLGILPKEKYFYMPGISYTRFTEPVTSLVENVYNFKSDVVYYATNKMVVDHFGDEVLRFLDENYVLVMDLSEYKKIYVSKDIALAKEWRDAE